jgi:hypothetical protein
MISKNFKNLTPIAGVLKRRHEAMEVTNFLRRMSPLLADIVAKVFLGWRTKILRANDAFDARRCEGPYRFIQNRSRAFVLALRGGAATEKSRNRLSRDF